MVKVRFREGIVTIPDDNESVWLSIWMIRTEVRRDMKVRAGLRMEMADRISTTTDAGSREGLGQSKGGGQVQCVP